LKGLFRQIQTGFQTLRGSRSGDREPDTGFQSEHPDPIPTVGEAAMTVDTDSDSGEIYTPVFDYDGLHNDPKVIHNHDFMRDPRYVKAFRAGQAALGHDHKMFWRLHTALWCAQQASRLDGDFVECGVWRGFLSTAIMNYLDWDRMTKTFYLFDTWDGLHEAYLTEGEKANSSKVEHLNRHFRGMYESVSAHFAHYPRVRMVRGTVPDTLNQVQIEKISFLSIDLNCVRPEIAAAHHFWDRLVPGAMLLLDDHGFVSYEEQKVAFDQFAREKGTEVLALPTGQGLIIKT
jgi:hypothetical protein